MSAAAWAETIPSLWEGRFAQEIEQTKERHPEVPVSQWRTAGRRTKTNPNKEDLDWWRTAGLEMVERYVQWREATQFPVWATPDGGPGIELELMVPFGQIPVHMFIDRVFETDEGPVIVDLKTGSREPDSALQLAFYAAGIEIAYGIRPRMGAYWMGRTGELTRPYLLDHLSTPLLANWLTRFNVAVREGIFLPHPSRLCGSCGVASACAAVGGPDAWKYDLNHPLYTGEMTSDRV